MLAKSKLDSIVTLVSQALIDMEINHEKINAIIRDKQKYERLKENVRDVSESSSTKKQENMRLNSVNSKIVRNSQKLLKICTVDCVCVCVCVCVCIKWLILAKKHIKTTT